MKEFSNEKEEIMNKIIEKCIGATVIAVGGIIIGCALGFRQGQNKMINTINEYYDCTHLVCVNDDITYEHLMNACLCDDAPIPPID